MGNSTQAQSPAVRGLVLQHAPKQNAQHLPFLATGGNHETNMPSLNNWTIFFSDHATPADAQAIAACPEGPLTLANGEVVQPLVVEEEVTPGSSREGGSPPAKPSGIIFAVNPIDPDELAKEDYTRSFEGVLFRVELVDDGGKLLDEQDATQARSEADAMVAKRAAAAAKSKTAGENGAETADDAAEKPEVRPENEGRVVYETNGNCAPYRVIIFAATDDNQEGEELMTVHVSRSGKVTIGDEEDEDR